MNSPGPQPATEPRPIGPIVARILIRAIMERLQTRAATIKPEYLTCP